MQWLEPFLWYAVLYSIKSNQIRSDKLCVLAVVNLKPRPMYWVGEKER